MNHVDADGFFLEYCERQRRLDPKTISSYRHVLSVFWSCMEEFGEIGDTDAVNREAVQYYMGWLSEQYRPSSAALHLNVAKTYFNYLEDCEYISRSPFRRVRSDLGRRPEGRPNVLSLDEVRRILNAAFSGNPESDFEQFLYYRDCTVLDFLFCTGMRVQELCDLRLTDLEPETGIIHVTGKRKKYRKCYITADQSRELLNSYLKVRKHYLKQHGVRDPHLFMTRFCKPMATNAIRNLIRKYAELARINRNITPHTFRHTFASALVEQGVDLSYIQAYLGHSTIATTQIYLHISDDSARLVLQEKHPRTQLETLQPKKLAAR